MRLLKPFLLVVVFLGLGLAPARAIDIQEVTSPGGIKAWLVESRINPLIAMNFSFAGGASSDPQGKEGASHFLTGMLDEGAGDMDAAAFQMRRDDLAMKLSFDQGHDNFEGSFQALSKNRDESFALLKLALTAPRFDAGPMERVRSQIVLSLRQDAQDPEKIASDAWMKAAFGAHPYGRDTDGTPQTNAALTADDLRAAHRRLFSRKGLKIAVVGDIGAGDLARLLDSTFGALPASDPPPPPALAEVAPGPRVDVIELDIPQSIIVFGHGGILRDDPDFFPAYVMSYILGGGGFSSRLTDEVREKRGLTYGIGAGLYPFDRAGLFLGNVGTRNDRAAETIAIVKAELKRMAETGPTAEELADAKTYLTGSYGLRFDSNTKIAGQLLGIQEDDLGIDYVNRRNAMIEAVTQDQAAAQARRLIHPDSLRITIVGRPEGVKTEGGSG